MQSFTDFLLITVKLQFNYMFDVSTKIIVLEDREINIHGTMSLVDPDRLFTEDPNQKGYFVCCINQNTYIYLFLNF